MPGAVDTWNGYSASGVAEGEVVYVNYGREEDYAVLEKLGISLEGKIVIVRHILFVLYASSLPLSLLLHASLLLSHSCHSSSSFRTL